MTDPGSQPGPYWPVPLADFARPPVTETALGLHFGALRPVDSLRIVEFWQRELRSRFPEAEERDRHIPSIESFDAGATMTPRLEFRRGQQAPRYWFRSQNGSELVQLQNDWLAFNWRKASPDVGYQHYAQGASQFEDIYGAFDSYVQGLGARSIEPLQIEVTYVNQIRAIDGGWATYDDLHHVFGRAAPGSDGHLPPSESQAIALQFLATDSSSKPFGRLYVTVEAGADDSGPVFVLTLTFKARPSTADRAGVMAALDNGHHWIVGGFDELTTSRMHDLWGRKERT